MLYKEVKINDANGDLSRQWFVYYSFKHPESGKYVRFRKFISNRIKTKSGRWKKAHELKKQINSKLHSGWNPFSTNEIHLTNVVKALDFALSLKKQTISKRGYYTYSSVQRIFIRWLTEMGYHKLAIDEMNSAIAREFCDHMLLEENLKPRTYNNRVQPLRTLFEVLHKREFILFNPFENIEKLKTPESEIIAYNTDELELIRNTLPQYNYQIYVISQLIFYCFLRPAEIVRLQFKDVLWDHDIIVMPGTKTKNKKSEVIILPDQLKRNLINWDLNFPPDYFLFSRNLLPGTKEIAPTRIANAWQKYAKEFGITKNIYHFKHTGNGFAFDQGFNSRDIQLQNRHSSLDETQKYLNRFRRIASDKFKKEFKGF